MILFACLPVVNQSTKLTLKLIPAGPKCTNIGLTFMHVCIEYIFYLFMFVPVYISVHSPKALFHVSGCYQE